MPNLGRTKGIIIKVRSRDRSGRLIHKSNFSLDDKTQVRRELKLWRDKLGVENEIFKNLNGNNVDREEINDLKKLVREKIEEDNKKLKEALSK